MFAFDRHGSCLSSVSSRQRGMIDYGYDFLFIHIRKGPEVVLIVDIYLYDVITLNYFEINVLPP